MSERSSSSSSSSSSKQIRPKVRKTLPVCNSLTVARGDSASVEEVRQRIEAWTGVKAEKSRDSGDYRDDSSPGKKTSLSSHVVPCTGLDKISTQEKHYLPASQRTKPTSILKSPKYSRPPAESSLPPMVLKSTTISHEKKSDDLDLESSKPQASKPIICKNIVVERDPTKPMPKRKTKHTPNAHAVIEGHVPTSLKQQSSAANLGPAMATEKAMQDEKSMDVSKDGSNNEKADTDAACDKENDDDSSPLILNSLEDLFLAAGQQLPQDRTTITPDTQLLEADISFSVMTQEQYEGKLAQFKRERQEELEAQMEIFLGKENVFDDEQNSFDDEDENDDDDDDLMDFLMEQEMDEEYDDEEEDDLEEDEPRSFRRLWDALLNWITPEAVEWMTRLESTDQDQRNTFSNDWSPQVDRSDIGASRCAGLMAMIKLYLPKTLHELQHPQCFQRTAETRLVDLLRTFNYSQEAPKLEVKLWKAMTCVFLDMVLVERRDDPVLVLPPSAQDVDMTLDEYRYLTRSFFQTFRPV